MSDTPLTFVHLTDLHLDSGESGSGRFRKAVEEINALDPQPAFVLVTGDFTIDSGVGEMARNLLGDLAMPFYATTGNHDLLVGEPDPKASYRELFGASRYSFDRNGVHLIVLDATQPAPERPGWLNAVGRVDEAQLAWLRADLAAVPPETPIIAVTHLPLLTTLLDRMDAAPEEAASWRITDGDKVIESLLRHNVRLVLQGHLHENEHLWIDDMEIATTGAICGAGWDAPGLPAENPDGSPKGYRIVTVTGGEVATRYQALGEANAGSMRAEAVRNGSGDFLVNANVFDGSERWRVECSVDGGSWRPMTRLAGQATHLPRGCPHWWEALVSAGENAGGGSRIEVRAMAPNGTSTTEAISVIH